MATCQSLGKAVTLFVQYANSECVMCCTYFLFVYLVCFALFCLCWTRCVAQSRALAISCCGVIHVLRSHQTLILVCT